MDNLTNVTVFLLFLADVSHAQNLFENCMQAGYFREAAFTL